MSSHQTQDIPQQRNTKPLFLTFAPVGNDIEKFLTVRGHHLEDEAYVLETPSPLSLYFNLDVDLDDCYFSSDGSDHDSDTTSNASPLPSPQQSEFKPTELESEEQIVTFNQTSGWFNPEVQSFEETLKPKETDLDGLRAFFPNRQAEPLACEPTSPIVASSFNLEMHKFMPQYCADDTMLEGIDVRLFFSPIEVFIDTCWESCAPEATRFSSCAHKRQVAPDDGHIEDSTIWTFAGNL